MRDFSDDTRHLSLNTATLGHMMDGQGAGWSPEQVVDACAERGYGGICFWRREVEGRAHAIGEYARAAGLAVTGLCRTPFLIGPLAASSPAASLDDCRRAIDTTAELGAMALTMTVGGIVPGTHSMTDSLATARDMIAALLPHAEDAGVDLALEPLHPVYGGNRSCLVRVADAIDILQALAHDRLLLAVDVYHVWWDLSLSDALSRIDGDRIASYHLCDWLADTQDVLTDRGMMGDGVADLPKIRAAVEATGFQGYNEVEIFSVNNWWRRDPDEVLDVCLERYRTVC